jgi:uncharacterized Zn finger protein (UPF0148 family)
MPSNKKMDGIKRTSDMMVSGWKMLSQHCPVCSSPLMSKGITLRCPGCDMPVVKESDMAATNNKYYTSSNKNEAKKPIIDKKDELDDLPQLISNINNNNNNNSSFKTYSNVDFEKSMRDILYQEKLDNIADNIADNSADNKNFKFESLEEKKKEYDLYNKKSNDISNLIGEGMMKGWALLGDICPDITCNGTPLMKTKAGKGEIGKISINTIPIGSKYCVSCNNIYATNTTTGGLDIVKSKSNTKLSPSSSVKSTIKKTNVDIEESKTIHMVNDEQVNYSDYSAIPTPLYDISNAPDLSLEMDANDVENSNNSKEIIDASATLSKYLLQGWALLDEVCIEGHCDGHVPLMKDLNNKKQCVYCGHITGEIKKERLNNPVTLSNSQVKPIVKNVINKINRNEREYDYDINNDVDDNEDDMNDLEDEEAYNKYSKYRLIEANKSNVGGISSNASHISFGTTSFGGFGTNTPPTTTSGLDAPRKLNSDYRPLHSIANSIYNLSNKIENITNQINSSNDVEFIIASCSIVEKLSETIQSLYKLL